MNQFYIYRGQYLVKHMPKYGWAFLVAIQAGESRHLNVCCSRRSSRALSLFLVASVFFDAAKKTDIECREKDSRAVSPKSCARDRKTESDSLNVPAGYTHTEREGKCSHLVRKWEAPDDGEFDMCIIAQQLSSLGDIGIVEVLQAESWCLSASSARAATYYCQYTRYYINHSQFFTVQTIFLNSFF